MSSDRKSLPSRAKRLAADLRDPKKRPKALRRVRRRIGSLAPVRQLRKRGGAAGSRAVVAATPDRAADSKVVTTAQPSAAPVDEAVSSVDARWAHAWGNLAAKVRGSETGADPAQYDWRLAAAVSSEAELHRGQAVLGRSLAEGRPLPSAVRRAVDELAKGAQWAAAWSLVEGVGRLPDGELAGDVGHLLLLHRRRQLARLWQRIEGRAIDYLARHLPVEAVDAALAEGGSAGRRLAGEIAENLDVLTTPTLVELAGRFLATGDRERTAALAEEIHRRGDIAAEERIESSWIEIQAYLDRTAPEVPAGVVPLAVFDYQSPDQVLASGNLGHYVQTLGLMGNLARFSSVTFTGEGGLGELATELQDRVRPSLRLPEPGGAIHLLPVDRDFSSGAELPEPTWLFAFGWHMHPIYDIHFDFPYHRNLRPLFLSVHVNRLGMLSEEGLDYLRRHGPVGCRDWTSVYLLLSAGVDAFFTGCVTTTIDAVFPARSDVYDSDGAYGLVDITAQAAGDPAPPLAEYTHQDNAVRRMPFVDGVREASDRLAEYQQGLRAAATRRLHAFLPMAALGIPVTFRPWSPGDPRFLGLRSIKPDSKYLRRMQNGLRDLIATTLTSILAGEDEEAVYATWRTATAGLVAQAKERYQSDLEPVASSTNVAAAIESARRALRAFGQSAAASGPEVTTVVLCFDEKIAPYVPVTIQSIMDHATGPVRFYLLTRGVGSRYQRWLGGSFPGVPITFLPCDGVEYGAIARLPERITVSTMDRLLLPHLLPEVDRAIYLDIDTLVLDDITELGRLDLQGHPIAARDSNVPEWLEWRAAVRRLPGRQANDVLLSVIRRNGFGQPAINAGVLVLDLARMRADDFTRTYLGWVEKYGFHDQDVMLAYAGSDRVQLPARWNSLPVLEDVDDPAIIHWAALPKPWEPELTFRESEWWAVADRVAERCGAGPDPAADASDGPGPNVPVQLGPRTDPLAAELERAITGVHADHLSYLGTTALRTLAASVVEIDAADIPGVFIETGTALGGSAIVMATAKRPGRALRVYDVFGMIPPPGERDGADVHARYAAIAGGASTGLGGELYYGYRDDLVAEVTESFRRYGVAVDDHDVELVRGLFADTLVVEEPVALAHLDGDWYESTMTCLTRIVPWLSPGGRIVVDDYDLWSGCRQAVDEYFAERPGFRFERRGKLHIVREGLVEDEPAEDDPAEDEAVSDDPAGDDPAGDDTAEDDTAELAKPGAADRDD